MLLEEVESPWQFDQPLNQIFKKRFANHKQSIEKRAKSNDLSKYVWELKDQNIEHTIKWEIVKRSVPYRCGTRFCELCLCEKYSILISDPDVCLNKNSEFLQKCRHKNKFKLCNISSATGDVGITWMNINCFCHWWIDNTLYYIHS